MLLELREDIQVFHEAREEDEATEQCSNVNKELINRDLAGLLILYLLIEVEHDLCNAVVSALLGRIDNVPLHPTEIGKQYLA